MGLLDILLGRTKPVAPDLDQLFALPSAAVTLEAAAGLTPCACRIVGSRSIRLTIASRMRWLRAPKRSRSVGCRGE